MKAILPHSSDLNRPLVIPPETDQWRTAKKVAFIAVAIFVSVITLGLALPFFVIAYDHLYGDEDQKAYLNQRIVNTLKNDNSTNQEKLTALKVLNFLITSDQFSLRPNEIDVTFMNREIQNTLNRLLEKTLEKPLFKEGTAQIIQDLYKLQSRIDRYDVQHYAEPDQVDRLPTIDSGLEIDSLSQRDDASPLRGTIVSSYSEFVLHEHSESLTEIFSDGTEAPEIARQDLLGRNPLLFEDEESQAAYEKISEQSNQINPDLDDVRANLWGFLGRYTEQFGTSSIDSAEAIFRIGHQSFKHIIMDKIQHEVIRNEDLFIRINGYASDPFVTMKFYKNGTVEFIDNFQIAEPQTKTLPKTIAKVQVRALIATDGTITIDYTITPDTDPVNQDEGVVWDMVNSEI